MDDAKATVTDERQGTKAPKAARRRQERAALEAALATRRCGYCGQRGCWKVASSPKPKRGASTRMVYLHCTGCGQPGKLPLPVFEIRSKADVSDGDDAV